MPSSINIIQEFNNKPDAKRGEALLFLHLSEGSPFLSFNLSIILLIVVTSLIIKKIIIARRMAQATGQKPFILVAHIHSIIKRIISKKIGRAHF